MADFDDIDPDIVEDIKQMLELIEGRNSVPFDGVLGAPPNWVPEWARSFFTSYRDRLLDARGYDHQELLLWIDRYKSAFIVDKGDPELFFYPPVYPNDEPVDFHCFNDEIGFLSWLKWCVDKGKKEGGERLGHGYKSRAKKAANSSHEVHTEAARFCVQEAGSWWAEEIDKEQDITRIGVVSETLWKQLKQSGRFQPKDSGKVRDWLKLAHKDESLEFKIPVQASRPGRPNTSN